MNVAMSGTRWRQILVVVLALGVGACETKPAKDTAKPGDKTGAGKGGDGKGGGAGKGGGLSAGAGGGANGAGGGTQGGDPENGQWTLDDATAGLAGDGKKLMAKFATTKGDILCELRPDLAPQTVASFIGLARGLRAWQDPTNGQWVTKPFFDGLAFHRVLPGFMIQGGDPLSRTYSTSERIGTGSPGYRVPDEFQTTVLYDKPGRLAMAHSSEPNSGGSQFFITDGPAKSLNGGYTVFGTCENQDVTHAIASVPVGPPMERGGMDPKPSRPVDAITFTVEIFRR